jgi:hypothetical protein
LIFEKLSGFFAKLPGIINFRIIFVRKKTWTRSRGRGPRPAPVHGGLAMDGGTELAGAWPPATLAHWRSVAAAGEREWDTGGLSPGLT